MLGRLRGACGESTVDGEVAGHRVSSFRSGELVRRGSAAARYDGKKTVRLMTIGCDIATTPERLSTTAKQAGLAEAGAPRVGPVAGGSHEASEPGQKGFERRVLAASELRCPGVQP